MKCCRDGCSSGKYSSPHKETLQHCESDHQILGHLSDKGSSPHSNYFHLHMIEATVLTGTFKAAELFLYPYKDLCLDKPLSRWSTDNLLNFIVWLVLWHVLITVGPYTTCVCAPFQIISDELNIPQVDSNRVVETSEGWISGNRIQ